MKMSDLLGQHMLSGVSFGEYKIRRGYNKGETANTVDFILDNEIISAIEDPCDGFRSAMRTLIKHRNVVIENTFPPIKVIGVEMPSDYDRKNDAIEFFDSITGKIVLSVGTENVDDYYPIFISRFNPENMVCNVLN